MTTQPDLPTVPPVVGGDYKTRLGYRTGPLSFGLNNVVLTNGECNWSKCGRLSTWKGFGHSDHDLVELIAMAVPIAEFQQLKRAQAAMEAMKADKILCLGITARTEDAWHDWLSHQPKKAD